MQGVFLNEQNGFDSLFKPSKGWQFRDVGGCFRQWRAGSRPQRETVHLREKQLGFCKGCLACLKLGHCVIQDDAVEIAAKMHDADVLVFATPVYYYSVCGQLKTMLDRANPLFGSDYAFTEAYLLATAAEDGRSTFDGAKRQCRDGLTASPLHACRNGIRRRRERCGRYRRASRSGAGATNGHGNLGAA